MLRSAGVIGAVVVVAATAGSPAPAAVPRDVAPAFDLGPRVTRAIASGVSEPLARLPRTAGVKAPAGRRLPARSLQDDPSPTTASFDGMAATGGVVPPDPNGDVGPEHYVQAVNSAEGGAVAVFDKAGRLMSGPVALSSLWTGLGGRCETAGEGDPIAQYDQVADRWVLSQFAFGVRDDEPRPPFFQCIAVSTSPDPAGTYHAYSFKISNRYLANYPKFGVWRDGYYMSAHLYDSRSGAYVAQGVMAFDRDSMLAGGEPRAIVFFANESIFGLLPADAQGFNPPPEGSPNYLVVARDGAIAGGLDRLELYRFFVDWGSPERSTVKGPVILTTQSFDSNMCKGSRSCIPQAGTTQRLDPIASEPRAGNLLMYPLAYRNFGTFEALALNHTVDATNTDHAGIRWYQVVSPGRRPFISDQGTYAPDTRHRWAGSISMDQSNDLGLGFSVSGRDLFPSVGFTGRRAGDPAGTMTQGEGTIVAGGGAQTGSNRWGDYSSMQVDPIDGCTFWYTQEYYSESSAGGWRTRVGAFSFPTCGEKAPEPSPPPVDDEPPRISDVRDAPDPFTPDGNGKKDRVKISWTVSESSDNKVVWRNRRGRIVRTFRGSVAPGSVYIKWNGTTDFGKKAGSGTFTYTISAQDSSGNRSSATGKTRLRR